MAESLLLTREEKIQLLIEALEAEQARQEALRSARSQSQPPQGRCLLLLLLLFLFFPLFGFGRCGCGCCGFF